MSAQLTAALRNASQEQRDAAEQRIRLGGRLAVGLVESLDAVDNGWPLAALPDKTLELLYHDPNGEPQVFVHDGRKLLDPETNDVQELITFASVAREQAQFGQNAIELIA